VPLFNPKNYDLNYEKKQFNNSTERENNSDSDDSDCVRNNEPEGFGKLIRRNESMLRRNSYYSQASGLAKKGKKSHFNPDLPGGGGVIPRNMNFEIFGDAIFEMSEEDEDDKAERMRKDVDASYNIYATENKKLWF